MYDDTNQRTTSSSLHSTSATSLQSKYSQHSYYHDEEISIWNYTLNV
jgi:hypothetical protein